MLIDGIATSEALDSSGELLRIKGHDISDLVEGRGVLNFEHNNDSPEDIIGDIVFAKKILTKDDCSNERERMYWDFCKTAFVYIKAKLFTDELHAGAIAASSILRYYHKKKEKILAGFSIEGSTLERDENILERTVGRRVALTLRPCNKQAISGVLEDDTVKKFMNYDKAIDGDLYKVDTCILDDDTPEEDPMQALQKSLMTLKKTLTAGSYNVAPSQLSGGAALSVEDNLSTRKTKDKVKSIISNWDRKRPLREVLKAALPEVSEDYIDHFEQIAQELSLKKNTKPLLRIDPGHSYNKNMDDSQKKLITGLYHDPSSTFDEGNRNPMFKLKNDAGADVLVKKPAPEYEYGKHDPSHAATDYYHLAKNFFGMGDHVPVTNHFDHPDIHGGSNSIQAQEFMPNAKSMYHPEGAKALMAARENGDLHKLGIIDMITAGGQDRHMGNILFNKGKVVHIDNDDAFDYGPMSKMTSAYFNDVDQGDGSKQEGIGKDTIHKDANTWLQGLDPKNLIQHMKKQDMDTSTIKEATRRLLMIKQHAASGATMQQMNDAVSQKSDEKKAV